ncbi:MULTISPECIES: alpha/beta fold hydrolase [unclassified Streptomyces]|uniref:thioesterase II family protein n=1 Tax=unclassified Streptomyces TaxID=2593676 RepID=UPI0036EBED54
MQTPAPITRPAVDPRWVLRPEPRDGAAVRLLCVPYAGGGTTVFHGWAAGLPDWIDVWLLRLPGREVRLREKPRTDLLRLAREAADALAPGLDGPFAVFGHSLGALIGFEVARELRRRHGLEVSHLTVSARGTPEIPQAERMSHLLSDEEFLDALDRRFRAVPPQIRQDPEMRALYLPVLRGDIAMLETYRYRAERPLRCAITALSGTEDQEAREEDMRGWRHHGAGGFTQHAYRGGHFFLQEHRAALLGLLAQDLARTVVP